MVCTWSFVALATGCAADDTIYLSIPLATGGDDTILNVTSKLTQSPGGMQPLRPSRARAYDRQTMHHSEQGKPWLWINNDHHLSTEALFVCVCGCVFCVFVCVCTVRGANADISNFSHQDLR